jgi:hypothetical protein
MALAICGTPGGALNSPPKPQQDSASARGLTSAPFDPSQQGARLLVCAQHAQLLAGRLIDDLAVELRAQVGHAQHVHQVLAQLIGAGGHGLGPALPLRLGRCQQPRYSWRTWATQTGDGETMAANGSKISIQRRAKSSASGRQPAWWASAPQQVCSSGNSTASPCPSSSATVASPTSGRYRSARQVMKRAVGGVDW